MEVEPEDRSSRPHPLPVQVARWIIRLIIPLIVVGFVWTIFQTVDSRSKAIKEAEAREETEIAFNQNPEIFELKTQLAQIAQKEAESFFLAREFAQKGGHLDEAAWKKLEAMQISWLKGKLIQAQIREENLMAEMEKFMAELGRSAD